jgi:hypothetical protein
MNMFRGAGGGDPGSPWLYDQPWIVPIRDTMPPGASPGKGKGDGGKSSFTAANMLAALGALGGQQAAPPPPSEPQWLSMPPSAPIMADLRNAPRLARPALMPAPDWMQPYLWGIR